MIVQEVKHALAFRFWRQDYVDRGYDLWRRGEGKVVMKRDMQMCYWDAVGIEFVL